MEAVIELLANPVSLIANFCIGLYGLLLCAIGLRYEMDNPGEWGTKTLTT